MGTHVHPWWIHVNMWQNQYNNVKQNKVKTKIKKKKKNLPAIQKTWVLSLDWEKMANHCSILAWRIPWTEKTSALPFMGWQSDLTFTFTFGS